jgi:tetratricopeptide (TPR) repeat protein
VETAVAQRPFPLHLFRLVRGKGLLGEVVLVFLLAFAVYAPVLTGQFVWDDTLLIDKNPLVTGEFGLGSIWFHTDFPLTLAAFWVQWLLWGKSPAGYHIINVLLHALNAVLVWRVLARLKVRGAWFAAVLFAIHPVCVASVAWISELKNTLSLPFFLLSLLWYVAADEPLNRPRPHSRPRPRNLFRTAEDQSDYENERTGSITITMTTTRTIGRGGLLAEAGSFVVLWARSPMVLYYLSLLAFLLALLAKTSTVMLPVVLLACGWWERGRISKRDLLRACPFFILALVFGLMTIRFQAQGAIGDKIVQTENLWARLAGAGMASWFYLGKALFPLNLNLIYPRWQIDASAALSYLPLVLWCGLLGICWRGRRAWGRPVLFALGCFTITLFPVLGFLDMYYLALSRVSDHFQYLPLIAIVALVSAGVQVLAREFTATDCTDFTDGTRGTKWESNSKQGELAKLGVNVAEISAPTGGKLVPGSAETTSSSVESVQSVAPGSSAQRLGGKLWAFLWPTGIVLGLSALTFHRAQVFAEGGALWRDTLAKNPAAWCAHNNLGTILAEQHQYEEAKTHFLASLGLNPDNAQAHSNLGIALAQEGHFAQAQQHFLTALKIKPSDADIHWAYAMALVRAGKVKDGLDHAHEALRLEPGFTRRRQLATLLFETGHNREAVAEYLEILSLTEQAQASYRAQRSEAMSNLAWLLATSPDPTLRNGPEAVRWGERACELTEYKNLSVLAVLAAAYAEAGRFKEAVTTAEKAVELATAAGNLQLAARNQELAELYRAGKAYHER